MKLRTLIDNVVGRYEVQVEPFEFTAQEEQAVADFGDPLIDVGGSFSGSVSRPNQVNTTVTITGDGTGATAVPVIVGGVITGINVTNGGTGYGTAAVSISGDGSGAAATATIVGGVITAITVDDGGADYNVVPTVVAFDLPSSIRRLKSDGPFKQVFDLEDDADSDVMAKVWGDTIVSRCTSAKAQLLNRTSHFEGETVITV